jgi:hypothetical protein
LGGVLLLDHWLDFINSLLGVLPDEEDELSPALVPSSNLTDLDDWRLWFWCWTGVRRFIFTGPPAFLPDPPEYVFSPNSSYVYFEEEPGLRRDFSGVRLWMKSSPPIVNLRRKTNVPKPKQTKKMKTQNRTKIRKHAE